MSTPVATEIVELTPEDYQALLEQQAEALVGMTVAAFMQAYHDGTVDRADANVSQLAGLLWLGQNGRPAH